MGKAMEIITSFATAISATVYTALVPGAGNSLTVRNAKEGSRVLLLNAWGDWQTAGSIRLRSPRLHDNVQGIRFAMDAANLKTRMSWDYHQILIPQDTLTLEALATAVVGDIETACLLLYYDDLPGVDARFIGIEAVKSRMKHLVTVENTLSLGTAGGYSGEEAINAEFNLLRANTDYAVLGYQVSAQCACIRLRGSDFGNLGVGGPGALGEHWITQNWFSNLSRFTGLDLIPVFNSANVNSILIDGAQDENGVDVTVNLILAELSGG